LSQFNFQDCIRERLLRKIPRSREAAGSSLKAADRWIDEAAKSLSSEAFNASALSSYLAMFHSARAILFLDGYREKSHYCIARYLEEKYVKNRLLEVRWVELLDHQRELRHASQYDVGFFTSEDEAKNTLETAKQFVERMKQLYADIR